MSAPIKTSASKQISWCLRFTDKKGKSYEMNRKTRRNKKEPRENEQKSKYW